MPISTSGNMVQQITAVLAWIFIGLLLISSHSGQTEARPSTSDDGYFTAPILKRNTWWSKKSLDALQTVTDTDLTGQENSKCEKSLEVYACYVERCVPNFVTCARQAEAEELFNACKMLHKLCASSCSSANQDRDDQL